MISLPPPLAEWGGLLDLFPEPLGAALHRVMAPLRAAIGPLRRGAGRGDGDFDGYDGLTRRGPYERLLPSEWLLADEAPEEFMRRAVMHEQAFLRPATRAPRSARVCAVLFDAGPHQLGTPRIAHLAALIVLQRRAIDAGCRFEWGVLQREAVPQGNIDSATLGLLLQSRTFVPAANDDLRRWQAVWPDAEEIWTVGLEGAHGNRLRIVETPDEAGQRALSVDIWRQGGTSRRVMLPLPSSEDCVRLLRDPLRPADAVPLRGGRTDRPPCSPLVFVDRGLRVCGLGPHQDVLLFAPPGRDLARHGWRLDAMHRPIAVGGHRRCYTVVSTDGAALYLQAHGRAPRGLPSGPCPLPGGVEVPAPPTLTACSALLGTPAAPYVLVLVGETLLRVSPMQAVAARATVEARDVRAALFNGRNVVVVQRQSSGLHALIALEMQPHPLTLRTVECEGACRFGSGEALHFEPFGMLAMEQTDHRWDILYRDADRNAACESITVPPTTRVLGPFGYRAESRNEPALIGLTADHQLLLLLRRGGVQVLADVSQGARAVRWAAVNPLRPQVALATETELRVYNLNPWGLIGRWTRPSP